MITWKLPCHPKFRIYVRFPAILRFKEKYGDRLFIINGEEDLTRAALKVIKDRFEDGYWYDEPEEPTKPDYSLEEAATLKGAAKEAALREIDRFQRSKLAYEEALEMWKILKSAVDNNDGRIAYYFLHYRSDMRCEYETLELLLPEDL